MKNITLILLLFGVPAALFAGARRKRKEFKIESQKLKILKFGDEKIRRSRGIFCVFIKNICFLIFLFNIITALLTLTL